MVSCFNPAKFFNPASVKDEDEKKQLIGNSQMETSVAHEITIDPERDVQIDFDKTYTGYTRFNGRYQDESIDFEETLTVLMPA